MESRIAELVKERDAEVQQCEDLKLQLHFAEDRIESCQAQLCDTARRLKDGNKIQSVTQNPTIKRISFILIYGKPRLIGITGRLDNYFFFSHLLCMLGATL